MIHLRSNQRLYISENLRGYVDKLIDDGTIPYAADFLKFGYAYAVREDLEPAVEFDRHTITTNTDILGDSKIVIEATAQRYAREIDCQVESAEDLLNLTCSLAISGGRLLKKRWSNRIKTQIQKDITSLLA